MSLFYNKTSCCKIEVDLHRRKAFNKQRRQIELQKLIDNSRVKLEVVEVDLIISLIDDIIKVSSCKERKLICIVRKTFDWRKEKRIWFASSQSFRIEIVIACISTRIIVVMFFRTQSSIMLQARRRDLFDVIFKITSRVIDWKNESIVAQSINRSESCAQSLF